MIKLTNAQINKIIKLYEEEVDNNYGSTIQINLDFGKTIDLHKLDQERVNKKEKFRKIIG